MVTVSCSGGVGQDCPPSAPAEGHMSRPVPPLFDQGLVEVAAGPGVDGSPAELAVILETRDVGAKERSELPSAARALAFVTQLIVQDIRLHLHPLVDVIVLQLDEASADGCDVALLV